MLLDLILVVYLEKLELLLNGSCCYMIILSYCGRVSHLPPGHCMALCQLVFVQVNCCVAVWVIKTRCVGHSSPALLLLCGASGVLVGVHVHVSLSCH